VTATRRSIREELGPGYEIFIVALSILSLFNIVIFLGPFDPETKEVARIVDVALCVVFMADFLGRLLQSHPRRAYFFDRQGYLDFLGSLPFPIVRLFRTVRIARGVRRVREMGGRRVLRRLVRERAQTALLFATFLVIITVELGSVLVVGAERGAPTVNIKTGGDALWWSIVTVTTVGYGDKYPVTAAGRVIGVFMLIGGVGLFGVFTGYVARIFLTPAVLDAEGEEQVAGAAGAATSAPLAPPGLEPPG
jgi:voltage-gated potassium channel Kch